MMRDSSGVIASRASHERQRNRSVSSSIEKAVGLPVGAVQVDRGYLTVVGKGSKERAVPLGTKAAEAVRTRTSED